VHTVVRAATPKPVKKLQRAAHPLSLAELKTEDAIVNALRGKPARKHKLARKPARNGAASHRAAVLGVAKARPVHAQSPTVADQRQPAPRPSPALLPMTLREGTPGAFPGRPAWPQGPDELRRQQWQADITERFARRQARITDQAVARQEKAAGRAAIYQMKATARQERRTAFKAARGSYGWPEWSLIAGLIAFVAWLTLVIIAGHHPASAPGLAAIAPFLVWLLAAVIAGPAALWRLHRAKQAAAAMLAGARQYRADQQTPPPEPVI
jgi:hypothetical protein